MNNLAKAFLWILVLTVAVVSARAQNRNPAEGARPREGASAGAPALPASLEERRTQYVALMQVKDALEKYLGTLDPSSDEHRAAAGSLRETEGKVTALERSLLEMLRSPALDGGPRVVSPPPPPSRPAASERAAVAAPPSGVGGEVTPAPDAGVTIAAVSAAATDTADARTNLAPAARGEAPAAVGAPQTGAADKASDNFMVWLNDKVEEKSVALINQGSNANQTETPAASAASTSLVDQSSASDLVGVALNLSGLSGSTNNDQDVNSASVTASAYSLYAAFKGADPLDPEFYNLHKKWRKLSLTLGYDNEQQEGETTADRVTLAGFKYLIFNGRDAGNVRNSNERCRVSRFVLNTMLNRLDTSLGEAESRPCDEARYLAEAANEFGLLEDDIIAFLAGLPSVRAGFVGAFTDFVGAEITKLQNDNAQDLANLARRGDPQNTRTVESLQQEMQQLAAAGAGEEDARVKNLQRMIDLKQGIDIRTRQAQELAKSRALDPQSVLAPARRSQWTAAERQFFRFGFKQRVLLNGASFQAVLRSLTPAEEEAIEKFVDAHINPFVKLNTSTRRALEEIRSRPQFSVSFLSKRRQRGADEYTSDLIYERGLATRTFATLNAGFKYKDSRLVGGDSRGGRISGQLQFQVTPEESLISKSPIYLFLSGESEWLSGAKPKYRAQAKVKIPVADGIDIPFSVTYANRSDLIDESEVRGQFGFTIDTAKLLRAFKFKLPDLGGVIPPFFIPQPPAAPQP